MVAATYAQTHAQAFLLARGLTDVDITAQVYGTSFPSDHVMCVLHVERHAHVYKIVIDPWMGVSLPYDDYAHYVHTHPRPPYTFSRTEFVLNERVSNVVNQPDFIEQARAVTEKYLGKPEQL
ncbi:hypothetical protein [Pandoraea sputorum]|uniref:hypothetical protein n=1 Tax=Pandoraea sputorum TaxID=93222 RepID=UPI0012403113|nr:hypothetical protein [Pandoraea sputorum]VVE54919.1 hypothetical protein PSP20601_04946 [Pandoraea sputorum]